jgi:hypothetical protein
MLYYKMNNTVSISKSIALSFNYIQIILNFKNSLILLKFQIKIIFIFYTYIVIYS